MQTQSAPVSASFCSDSAAAGDSYSPRLPTHPHDIPWIKPSEFGSCVSSAESRGQSTAMTAIATSWQENRRMETSRVKSFNPKESFHDIITCWNVPCKLQGWSFCRHGRYDGLENGKPFHETTSLRTGRQRAAGDSRFGRTDPQPRRRGRRLGRLGPFRRIAGSFAGDRPGDVATGRRSRSALARASAASAN